jgi:putative ABC transport system substrate-binding protein
MKRREFITLLGGAAATWPLAARAQQAERTRRIGLLMPFAAGDPEAEARKPVFEQTLRQLGWTVGANLLIEYRLAGGNAESIRRHAAELVALAPDVIVTAGALAPAPVLQATSTIPIVMVNVPDPVGAGWVQSLARPGGNATGFTNFEYSLGGKWVNCSSKWRLALPAPQSCGVRHLWRVLANSPRSSLGRTRWGSN